MDEQTSLWAELLVSLSASPASEGDWQTTVVTWPLNIFALLQEAASDGLFGKTSLEFCHRTEEGILEPSSRRWQNSGMGGLTESLTLNTSEWHSAAVVCSLSDTLETGDVPQRFYLSAKACQGILRREVTIPSRNGKLSEPLRRALEMQTTTTVQRLDTVSSEMVEDRDG